MGRWLVICHLFSLLLGDLSFIFPSLCHTGGLKTGLKQGKSRDSYFRLSDLGSRKKVSVPVNAFVVKLLETATSNST